MRVIHGVAVLAAGVLSACAPRTNEPARPVVPEVGARAVEATAPGPPLQILFDWTALERDARFTGRGAARVEAPYRARLDLFGPRGESYLSAAIVGDELRLPVGVSPDAVPPAPLLWSVLGVFRPPVGATLIATETDGTTVRIEYRHGEERWTFLLEDGRLRRAEWENGDGRHTVELSGRGAFGLPRRAVYRDWAAFTELTLNLDEVERVESFPPDIWAPVAP